MVAWESSYLMVWFVRHPGLAIGSMVLLLALTCLLTWRDPIIRARLVPPLLAMSGWASMAALPMLLALFDAGAAATLAWCVAGLYALSIVATLGRPLLISSDLLDDAESEGSHISASERRRARIGQLILIGGVCAAVVIVMA